MSPTTTDPENVSPKKSFANEIERLRAEREKEIRDLPDTDGYYAELLAEIERLRADNEISPYNVYKNALEVAEKERDELKILHRKAVDSFLDGEPESIRAQYKELTAELALAKERLGPAGKILEEVKTLRAEIERLQAEAKETNDIYIKNFEQQRRDYVELAKAYAEALKKLDALKPFPKGKLTNSGHGHVYSRLDGSIARCGGPGLCGKCSADLARKLQDEDEK